jgi:O-antigen/teichoic acid export membrane protein
MEGGWVVAGQIASVLGSLLLVRVLTEHLNPALYGQLALGLTVATLMTQLVMGGVINAIGRFFVVAAEQRALHVYFRASQYLMLRATQVVFVIGVALVSGLYGFGFARWIPMSLAALLFAILTSYNAALSGIQNAARQRAVVAVHGGVDAWLKILFAWLVLKWWGSQVVDIVLAYVASAFLVNVSQLLTLRRKVTLAKEAVSAPVFAEWCGKMFRYSMPFATWGIFTWFQLVSDRWALEVFATTEDVGLYTVLFQIGVTPITIAATAVISFLAPILYGRAGDALNPARTTNVRNITRQTMIASLFLTLCAFFLAVFLHSWVFQLLVSSRYFVVSHLLPWMVLAGGVFATGQILAIKLMSDMQPGLMAQAKIVTAVVGVCFNVFGAFFAGLYGVIVAQLAFSFLYFAWMVRVAFHARSTIET